MNKKILLAVAACALALAACGDDVTEVTEIRQEGMAVLEKGEKLSKQACDTANVGEMLFVMDSVEAFICDGESWRTLKGADGKDGSDGKDGTDGKDGSDGKDGTDGEDGQDGMSCSAKYVIDKAKMLTGVALFCGGSIVDTIWNGADGKDGSDGKDGTDGKDGVDGKDGTDGEDGKDMTSFPGAIGSFVDNRDGHVYRTVVVGSQTWMAENLNYAMNPGEQSWCGGGEHKSKNEGDCSVYGRLYTWEAALRVCPEGWHLPDSTEWKTLIAAVGDEDVSGTMLKSASGWSDCGGACEKGVDAFGFSVLPAGRSCDVVFNGVGEYAYIWSAKGYSEDGAYSIMLDFDNENAYLFHNLKRCGSSVRCLKD